MTDFVAAESKLEATARIYSLAGAAPEPLGPGSKERKSVLVVLARALDLDVDLESTKPLLGGQIARELGTTWEASCYSTGATITLVGLNRLLQAASAEFERRRDEARVESPPLLAGWADFVPARSKLEAVNRISALTSSGPQALGPGSKERKSVLTNLASGLGLGSRPSMPKSLLGADLASRLAVPWDDTCHSAGETITLDGLNVLLAGAERHLAALGRPPGQRFLTPEQEAAALLGVLDSVIESHWDGRRCVERMRDAEFRNWRQTEWPGFYFEFVGIPALIDAFGGGPVKVGNVTFDYRLDTVWDLKCHSAGGGSAPLNDGATVERQVDVSPLGFVVLTGRRHLDDTGAFDQWHRQITVRAAGIRSANSERRRQRKSGFTPTGLAAYLIRDRLHLQAMLANGGLSVFRQGREPGGSARKPKYHLRLDSADQHGMRVASVDRGH